MPLNRQLSRVLRGKVIAAVQAVAETVAVQFADGSEMTVRGHFAGAAVAALGRVLAVHEDGATVAVLVETGSACTITMSDPGGSVLVRDAAHHVLYAG